MKAEYMGVWPAMAVVLAAGMAASGCGTPGAPQPPSLKLPNTVTDLAALRTGNQVALTWTMPKKNTDKLVLKGAVPAYICRQEAHSPCAPAGNLQGMPGTVARFTDTLPAAQARGEPRVLNYFVELKNRNGRSAGLSNAAAVLAGEAPAAVEGLSASVIMEGAVLRWTPIAQESALVSMRLERKLLSPPAAKPPQGPLAPPPEPLQQKLLVDGGAHTGHALDKEIRFGEAYEYRAQRVARVTVGSDTLELAGPFSAPVRVEAKDVFPPAVPTGLAAVATAPGAGTEAAIDLSWQPGAETDLAGYAVYRREGQGAWQRISPGAPLAGPAFHDTGVRPGHTYRYAVSAIDQGGHESARSAEAEENVPNP